MLPSQTKSITFIYKAMLFDPVNAWLFILPERSLKAITISHLHRKYQRGKTELHEES